MTTDLADNPQWIIEVGRTVGESEDWSPLPGGNRTLAACRAGVEERAKLTVAARFGFGSGTS